MSQGLIAVSLISLSLVVSLPASAQKPDEKRVERMVGHLFTPERLEFSEKLMDQLEVPEGFEVGIFARDLEAPRMMAVGEDGTVYVTRPDKGDVLALSDDNGDGRTNEVRTVASDLDGVHGIAIHDEQVYLATPTQVYVVELQGDGGLGEPELLIDDLPDGGQHPNRTLAFGPDGKLYISVGSTCNACDEPNPEHATLLRAKPDGSNREIFAEGLRNTIGFGWHPETGELWGADHGSDWRGDDIPPDEINRLQQGSDYGWPFCYGEQQVDELLSSDPEGTSKQDYCSETEPAALTYQAHSAPIGMVFYNASQFPEGYRGDAFIAMRGSWNRKPPSGYEVVRVRFEDGEAVAVKNFLTGFLVEGGDAYFARPAGVAVAQDGALLVSDDTNGIIYRITYQGDAHTAARRQGTSE